MSKDPRKIQKVDISEFENVVTNVKPKPGKKHPQGWEPGIKWSGSKGGEITTGPLEGEPTSGIWDNLIADWGLDPKTTKVIDGSVQVRAWDSPGPDGTVRRLKYYRASLAQATASTTADVEELIKRVSKKRAVKASTDIGTERALVVMLSDWQVGKGEGGGTPAFIERLLTAFDRLENHLKYVHKRTPLKAIYLIGMGDLVESCSGFYAMQTFQTDLDEREQARVVRHLLIGLVDRLVEYGLPIVLGAVPGNHGEKRNGSGKAYTNWTDNGDLEAFEIVAEVLAQNPGRYGTVTVPTGAIASDLTLTMDICGIPVGFAHGHQIRGAGGVTKWWQGQSLGRQSVGDAHVLVTAHKHHFSCTEESGRFHAQCPAMDGGSYWFTASTGKNSPSGLLTMVIGTDAGTRGWSDIQVL